MTGSVRRRSSLLPRSVKIALVIAILAGGPWSALWLLAEAQANRRIDLWIEAEQRAGRQWTCPARTVEGYPFALWVTCARPTFRGEIAGRATSGVVEGLRAGLSLAEPRTAVVELRGPMNLHADDEEFGLMVSWTGLRVTTGALPQTARQASLDATKLAVTLSVAGKGDFNGRAESLDGTAAPAGQRGDMTFGFKAAGIALPTVEDFTGDGETIVASGAGVLARADLLAAPTVARLEQWRQAGGRLELASLRLDKGEFQGRFSGALGLDEAHRMAGKLDAQLSGFGPLAERFGIPLAGVKIGGLLTSLLGGKAAPSGAPGDTVRLPLVFAEGRLSIGPFPLPVHIDPLY